MAHSKQFTNFLMIQEEHKATFSGLRISEMTLSNQSHFRGFFLFPESHLPETNDSGLSKAGIDRNF